MERVECKIDVTDLAVGMYVASLDRPWIETPFPLQGFLVRSSDDIDTLKQYCRYVVVDTEKGKAPATNGHAILAAPPRRYGRARDLKKLRDTVQYADQATLEEELPRALEAHRHANMLTRKIFDEVRAGKKLAIEAVNDVVEPVVQSVLRNADAFFWISSLRKSDGYAYSHAINSSALAVAFGRHLGFPQDMLLNLASGGLLLDVGKARVPERLLMKPAVLSESEFEIVKKHVVAGVRLLAESGGTNSDVHEMIMTHHERHDGSGYPESMIGTQIPLFGRMMSIVDCFDAMTSDRPYRKAMARHKVLQQLYRWRDGLFQAELVEQFLQCLGVYPTGSLVELSTGEVAIVMAQNRTRRLRPRVMLLLSPEKQLYLRFPEIDLMAQAETGGQGGKIDIVKTLDPGAYGLDPTELYIRPESTSGVM